jgi:hypothetical protein
MAFFVAAVSRKTGKRTGNQDLLTGKQGTKFSIALLETWVCSEHEM